MDVALIVLCVIGLCMSVYLLFKMFIIPLRDFYRRLDDDRAKEMRIAKIRARDGMVENE